MLCPLSSFPVIPSFCCLQYSHLLVISYSQFPVWDLSADFLIHLMCTMLIFSQLISSTKSSALWKTKSINAITSTFLKFILQTCNLIKKDVSLAWQNLFSIELIWLTLIILPVSNSLLLESSIECSVILSCSAWGWQTCNYLGYLVLSSWISVQKFFPSSPWNLLGALRITKNHKGAVCPLLLRVILCK